MTTMLEKMAVAMARMDDCDPAAVTNPRYWGLARAALQAIRVPDDRMLRAAFVEMNRTPGRTWKQMKSEAKTEREIFDAKTRPRHTAMIDAILNEKP